MVESGFEPFWHQSPNFNHLAILPCQIKPVKVFSPHCVRVNVGRTHTPAELSLIKSNNSNTTKNIMDDNESMQSHCRKQNGTQTKSGMLVPQVPPSRQSPRRASPLPGLHEMPGSGHCPSLSFAASQVLLILAAVALTSFTLTSQVRVPPAILLLQPHCPAGWGCLLLSSGVLGR